MKFNLNDKVLLKIQDKNLLGIISNIITKDIPNPRIDDTKSLILKYELALANKDFSFILSRASKRWSDYKERQCLSVIKRLQKSLKTLPLTITDYVYEVLVNGKDRYLIGSYSASQCLNKIDNSEDITIINNSPRELATQLLGQLELYGDFYYQLEDWLTDYLRGDKKDMPLGVEGEYLKCVLRLEVRDFFDNKYIKDIESEDIEECVDRIINHCSVNVLDVDFISDIVDEYLDEKESRNRLQYLLEKEKVSPLDKNERLELIQLKRYLEEE